MRRSNEDFEPLAHLRPVGFRGRVARALRLIGDFQVFTVERDVTRFLGGAQGTLIDVGAGGRPYEHLVPSHVRYVAVDIARAGRFGYDEPAVWFDGDRLPFGSASVDHVLCTEVLEHVERPDQFVEELHRVLKPGGAALVTVPWSARYHYVPWDFHRFTPARLQTLFAPFTHIVITPRGTDLTVIASKLIVAYARLCAAARNGGIGAALLAVALSPLIAASVLFGHATLKLSLGSGDDPLGYTILASKAAAPVAAIRHDDRPLT